MSQPTTDEHLSQMVTTWTVLFQAHSDHTDEAVAAQQQLLQRYSGAVYRYLLAAVRKQDEADDLFQEFALRLVRGAFKNAHPEKGKFRHFLKSALYHLVIDHQRKKHRRPPALPRATPGSSDTLPASEEADRQFLATWRKELLNRAWGALRELEERSGQPLYTVLRYRTDHPDTRSAEMAIHFSPQMGKELNAQWIRKRLFLAREKFTDLLLDEVARSLTNPTDEELEEELGDLGLLEHCREALQRRRQRGK
jgi:RNA polymerase sigma factor (sigma-70 family)